MIILFGGKARAGKDTVASMMKEYMPDKIEMLSFARSLKECAREFLGWDMEKDLRGRTFLQTLGTECGREFYEDAWVDIAKNGLNSENEYKALMILEDIKELNYELSKRDGLSIHEMSYYLDLVSSFIQALYFGVELSRYSSPKEKLQNHLITDAVVLYHGSLMAAYDRVSAIMKSPSISSLLHEQVEASKELSIAKKIKDGKIVLMTDGRFMNEIKLDVPNTLRVSIYIAKGETEEVSATLTSDQAKHPSETSVSSHDFDVFIHNKGTLDELNIKAISILNGLMFGCEKV
jgi:hypothetical protein